MNKSGPPNWHKASTERLADADRRNTGLHDYGSRPLGAKRIKFLYWFIAAGAGLAIWALIAWLLGLW
ncbi:hypothetical protein B2G71_05995 [Novosphingobium sp. PC22D]|uniref:hypothetical protein n=1 Tax=Novosphingobium sp. PC22D TaxID=1962403 RepID=UPI000BF0488D|nr:hypothetical protein [Novosphingobium sp. PC22D]PEQ13854.1 hypothetical protein B2G71_05995 [Novosphingobium sp. PC22D]